MRFFTSLLLTLFLATSSWGQVVITEIMYNPPESGIDTYEYVEIFNAGNSAVNLLGYSFSTGFEYTFTSGFNLGVGEYALFATDSMAFEAAFGITAFQITNGSLSNGGEVITLVDDTGGTVDEVDYDDSFPWDATADGSGASLVLCDVSADNNDGANWDAASTGTGFISNDVEVFGNPGGASSCPEGAVVRFLETEYEFGEGDGIVTVSVEIRDAANATLSVDVEIDMGASTVDFDTDVTVSSTTLNFDSGDAIDTLDFTISIIDDAMVESIETLVLNLANASMGVSIDGVGGSTTASIVDNDTDIPNIVINEIMYNPPGADDMYEYLELHNNDDVAVNVNGFYFTAGISDTLHDVSIPAGGFLVLATDSVAYMETYGGPAYQWTDGGLGNGGETIELRDALGNVVDVVAYDDAAPWDEAADGSGSSLVLCDPSTDNNLAASWIAGVQPTGVFISGSQILGSPGAVNNCVPPEPMGYTPYTIAEVTNNNAVGVADSLGVRAELTAVVYGVNLGFNGVLFTIIDGANDGIAVFNGSNDFGYTVTEGDEVTIRGSISQFNGLTQINADTVILNSAMNMLVDPSFIVILDESTESQLIRISTSVTISNVNPTGGGINVTVTNGIDEYLMRIDQETGITEDFINGLASETLQITGIGGQFDGSEPHDEGYQVLPRYEADIQVLISTTEPAWGVSTSLFPNPATDRFNIRTEVEVEQIIIRNELGQKVQQLLQPTTSLDLNQLAAGLYFVELYHEGERVVRKLIKQ